MLREMKVVSYIIDAAIQKIVQLNNFEVELVHFHITWKSPAGRGLMVGWHVLPGPSLLLS